jgi:hypothetical protein
MMPPFPFPATFLKHYKSFFIDQYRSASPREDLRSKLWRIFDSPGKDLYIFALCPRQAAGNAFTADFMRIDKRILGCDRYLIDNVTISAPHSALVSPPGFGRESML